MAQLVEIFERHQRSLAFAVFVFAFVSISQVWSGWQRRQFRKDGLPMANRGRWWEPNYLARVRWITQAPQIQAAADKVAQMTPYRLCRGDTDQIILPPSMIPELNTLGMDVLNSRESHAFALLGHLTGMDVVRKTSFHVRVLLSYISPALPQLFPLTAKRISASIEREFPSSHEWTVAQPSKAIVRSVSESIALVLFGADMTADNQHLVNLTHEHTANVFAVCFTMRCVPEVLQSFLVWLLPARWRLIQGWRKFEAAVIPRVEELKAQQTGEKKRRNASSVNPDVISWMVEDGRNDMERDPKVLTTLIGSLAAGSTYSITNFCSRTLMDLVKNPDVLEAVRAEIRQKHVEINGQWNMAAIASLVKLESAMKESSRMTPGTIQIYSRHVKKGHLLSNGVHLRRGQYITISTSTRTRDPAYFDDPYEYQGLRFCSDDQIEKHRQRPFSSVDTDILTWGAGRWACPGRLISDIAAKVLLIKVLDEYDLAFVDKEKPLTRSVMHEFLYFHPDNEMLIRKRKDGSGIVFC